MKIGEVSKTIGVSAQTIRRWDRTGELVPHLVTKTGHRLYLRSDITAFLTKTRIDPQLTKISLGYINRGFIADGICPNCENNNEGDGDAG